jgi:hypothetical protein
MMDKQLKVQPGQSKCEGPGARSGQASASLLLRTPDTATLLANQLHGLATMMAATEKLLEGATETPRSDPAQVAD